MMDTVCMWVGGVVVIGVIIYAVVVVGFASYIGSAFMREWRKP